MIESAFYPYVPIRYTGLMKDKILIKEYYLKLTGRNNFTPDINQTILKNCVV